MPKDGFSIMTVMIGSVVVAALAVVYMQKARNKAQVAAITDIIAYRDYVFRYYSEVAANRMAWPCTLKANPALQTYVNTGVGATGPHNLWLHDADSDSCVLSGVGKLIITGSGAGAAQGLGLMLYEDLPDTPVETYDPATHHMRVYTTWEGLGNNAVRVRLAAKYNYERDNALTSFKIKEKETFIYMGRTPARNCGESLGHLGFHDDRGAGTRAPQRYFGDTALTSLNAETRLVTCWEQGPLIVPPCFDLLETTDFPHCPSIASNPTYAGMCPDNLYFKVPAVAGFDPSTGETICENDFGLILGDRTSSNAIHCGTDTGNAFQGVKSNHYGQCSKQHSKKRFGVLGSACPNGHRGWDESGSADCGDEIRGTAGPKGHPGHPGVLRASPGPPGPGRICDCISSS